VDVVATRGCGAALTADGNIYKWGHQLQYGVVSGTPTPTLLPNTQQAFIAITLAGMNS